jgi:hypothetical protein
VAAQKKASKQDKIRSELLALPSMARIKIRVSAGVFEVSLIRVIEETSSVEVVWDRGVKREFKWGSVVFGNTDGPVLQKPSEILPTASERKSLIFLRCSGEFSELTNIPHFAGLPNMLPVPTYPSIHAATSNQSHPTSATSHPSSSSTTPIQTEAAESSANLPATSSQQYAPVATQTQSIYPPRTGSYADYWAYATAVQAQAQAQYTNGGQTPYGSRPPVSSYQYPYGGYYSSALAGGGQHQQYNPYTTFTQGYARGAAPQYRGGALNWQQPYQGPAMTDETQSGASAGPGGATGQPPAPLQGDQPQHYRESAQTSSTSTPSSGSLPLTPTPPAVGAGTFGQGGQGEGSSSSSTATVDASMVPSVTPPNTASPLLMATAQQQQQAIKDLAALSSLDPAQIADVLLSNPQLRDIVLAAIEQAKKAEA